MKMMNNTKGIKSRSKYQHLSKSQKNDTEVVKELSIDEQREKRVKERAKLKQLEKEENDEKEKEQAKVRAKIIQNMLKKSDDEGGE